MVTQGAQDGALCSSLVLARPHPRTLKADACAYLLTQTNATNSPAASAMSAACNPNDRTLWTTDRATARRVQRARHTSAPPTPSSCCSTALTGEGGRSANYAHATAEADTRHREHHLSCEHKDSALTQQRHQAQVAGTTLMSPSAIIKDTEIA